MKLRKIKINLRCDTDISYIIEDFNAPTYIAYKKTLFIYIGRRGKNHTNTYTRIDEVHVIDTSKE